MGNGSSEPPTEQKSPLVPQTKSHNKRNRKKKSRKGQKAQTHPLKQNMKQSNFKCSIALDFGTDGCGIAFAYNDRVTIYNQWKGQQTNSAKRATSKNKTKTQLILNENNGVVGFGNAAKFMYYNFEKEARQGKRFFEKFKMALYENKMGRIQDIAEADEKKEREDVDTNTYLRSADGQQVPAEVVFVAAFRTLKEKAKAFLPLIVHEAITDDEIQWIVTVPAIWSQKAKNNMREWIIKAGLVKKNILNQCVIVYEPDCASLSIQRQFYKEEYPSKTTKRSKPVKPSHPYLKHCNPTDEITTFDYDPKAKIVFEEDDKYLLVDAGGGTVDIACHKILQNGSVEEIMYPTGGKWGSTYIDQLFIDLLKQIFGNAFVERYKDTNPANFVQLMEEFELSKKTFYKKKHRDSKTHEVRLPSDFMGSLNEKYDKKDQDPERIIQQFAASHKLKYYKRLFGCEDHEVKDPDTADNEYQDEGDESPCVLRMRKEREDDEDDESDEDESDDGLDDYKYKKFLVIDVKIWKCLFDSKINPIISHMVQLLRKESMQYCKYLGLVGGFSASKYFQSRMKHKFGYCSGYTMNVIVPKFPMLSVVEGAAYMAITQDYIRARKLPFTYGVCLRIPRAEAADVPGMTEQYILRNLNRRDGFVSGKFCIIARKNERVGVNEVRSQKSYRAEGASHSTVPLYRSIKLNPTTQDDGERICDMKPPHLDQRRACITEFHFYGTMLKVYSYPKSSPQQKE
eukprot:52725_1